MTLIYPTDLNKRGLLKRLRDINPRAKYSASYIQSYHFNKLNKIVVIDLDTACFHMRELRAFIKIFGNNDIGISFVSYGRSYATRIIIKNVYTIDMTADHPFHRFDLED